MLNIKELEEMGKKAGFSYVALLKSDSIQLMPEVREMCKNNTCHMYAKRWSCPPGCGTLDQLRGSIYCYKEGILVQTVTKLEDEFDWDGMMKAQNLHQEHFLAFLEKLHASHFSFLPLGTGCCMLCKNLHLPGCTLPLPAKKDFFDGSMWYVGIGSMSEE